MENDIKDWEESVKDLEACDGVVTELDKLTVLMKMISTSNLVTNLRTASGVDDWKLKLTIEVDFLKEFDLLKFKPSAAHVVNGDVGKGHEAQESEDEDGDRREGRGRV